MLHSVIFILTFAKNNTMNKVTKIKKNTVLELDQYVNKDTGEILSSEVKGDTHVTVSSDTGLRTITSDDYAVIDSDALLTLMSMVNNSDLANIIKMAIVTKTPLNIVFNNHVPHTNESLQKYLELNSKSMFIKLIRRLIKIGVLYQIKGKIYGEVRVCYMLNPFLTRKRKQFESKVFEVFDQFKKENLNLS